MSLETNKHAAEVMALGFLVFVILVLVIRNC